jgi:predicted nucleic-acid-binding Zn-ribbon protein
MADELIKANSCPKCGAFERRRGRVFEAGQFRDIRFRADEASELSFKEPIVAFACSKCGYVEFYLENLPAKP